MALSGSSYKPPGRLGNPNMTLGQEPRLDVRLATAMKPLGMLGGDSSFPPSLGPNASIEDLTPSMKTAHDGVMMLYSMIKNKLPGDKDAPEISITTRSCKGPDGNEIKLHVFRPAAAEGKLLPGLLYLHGGGMTINDTRNVVHDRWVTSLAEEGLACVAVDYRNAWTPEGPNHYPKGLNDCAAAVRHIAANRKEFGISHFIIQGESGGGNLTLATALKANCEGWAHEIGGVWGTVPYISGAYGWPLERKLAELPSLVECDTYFLETGSMADMARYYSPNKQDWIDPHAWPYYATVEDMKGLPPHVISVDELDPLRDEGVVYYRRLLDAGVPASGRINLGLLHAAEVAFRQDLPDVYTSVVRDIAGFAKSLSSDSATKL